MHKRWRSSFLIWIAALLYMIGAAMAQAGALYFTEFPDASMGAAGAGAQALAEDAATARHNPAGMTRLEDHSLVIGGGFVSGDVEFEADPATPSGGGDGGQQAETAAYAGTYYVHHLSERWRAGFTFGATSAAELDPTDDWAGRNQMTNVEILIMEIEGSLAYKVNDWLSVGGGPRLARAGLELELRLPGPLGARAELDEADDWEVAFNLGALFTLSERTRIGLNYRSELDFDFNRSDLSIGPLGPLGVDLDLVLPQYARVGLVHEINDEWTLLASAGWEDWSELDEQILSTAAGSATLPREFDDTYSFSLGVRWFPLEKLMLQAGVAFDTNPVASKDRLADMPVDRQWRIAAGFRYQVSEDFRLGMNLSFADMGDSTLKNSQVRGEYDSNELVFFTVVTEWSRLPWSRE